MGRDSPGELRSGNRHPTKPFLKWAGGKRWLIGRHGDLFPDSYSTYLEPFLGGGAVFFGLGPRTAILSDANRALIDCYVAIQKHPGRVLDALRKHAASHSETHYYRTRDAEGGDSVIRAARFLYLNRSCWNGLYRVNRFGKFNVPKGTKDTIIFDDDDFHGVSSVLKSAEFRCCDFEETIDRSKRGDLIFCDPPYTVRHNNNGFIKYNDLLFAWDDQIRLRDALVRATRRGSLVVVTNANNRSVRNLYAGDFHMKTVSRWSVISGTSVARSATTELVITNF